MNNMIRIQTKIQLNVPIPNDISNVAGSDHTVIFNIESIITQTNKYMKFFNFGAGSSVSSSVGASFFIHRYQLYHTNKRSNSIPHHLGTKLFRSIQKIIAVIDSKNIQSLYINFFGINTGTANAEIHKMIHKLKMFDQIIFQMDNDPL